MTSALVLEHHPFAGPGHLGTWAEDRGVALETAPMYERAPLRDPRQYDLVVSLGSLASAYDDSVTWLGDELEFLERSFAEGVPVLGICFGGQLLARALGGGVYPAPALNVGWKGLSGSAAPSVGSGPWLFWHEDIFETPPGAKLLGHVAGYPAAFSHGSHLGLQFHPEADLETIGRWVERFAEELDEAGIDRERLVEESRRLDEGARAAAWRLFDGFLGSTRAS